MTDTETTLPIPDKAPPLPTGPLYRIVANDWLQPADSVVEGDIKWESRLIRLDRIVDIQTAGYAAGTTLIIRCEGDEVGNHLGNVLHGPVLPDDEEPHEALVALAQQVSAANRRMVNGR